MRLASPEVCGTENWTERVERYLNEGRPVSGGKKGREETKTATQGANALGSQASGIATQDQGKQAGYAAESDPFVKSLIPGANGALSPYAAAQFSQAKDNIDKTYGSNAAASERGLAARGFGNAPSGLTASIANTADANRGAADTAAYQKAQENTLGAGLQGASYLQNQQQIYNPLSAIGAGTGAYGTGIQGGAAMNKEGSLLGDIGSGLGTLSGLAGVGSNIYNDNKS